MQIKQFITITSTNTTTAAAAAAAAAPPPPPPRELVSLTPKPELGCRRSI